MIIYFLSYLIIILTGNYFILRKKLFLNNTGFQHQEFVNISVPLTGGIFLFVPALYLLLPGFLILAISYFFLFLLGLLSDLRIFESAKKRFLFQSLIIFLFVFINELQVTPTKIDFFDDLIQNTFWSYFFTGFCLMILINGSNFIDGMNSLLLGYFTSVLIVLFLLANFNNLILDFEFVQKAIICLSILFFLNIFGLLFVGDNGAYLISILVGYILIKFSNENFIVSPYFIAVLLWYPAYENLFSIIRKKVKKFDAFEADNMTQARHHRITPLHELAHLLVG